MMNCKTLLSDHQTKIIDVRTRDEFRGGHVVGSINIPLQEIQDHLNELKSMNVPFVLCCASGNRSEQATNFLTRNDIVCCNGGSWFDVNFLTSQLIK